MTRPFSTTTLLLAALLLVLVCLPAAEAFGAGNIPSFSFLEHSAFRHGDIEDILAELVKKTGGGLLSRGTKFSGLDIKRVYFGNWLRDYSQAMDVAALQKLKPVSILSIVMVLGFMAHGYVTEEFHVTDERLGVYLPTEHIDNPKGYADGKDAREYDPRLRGPIDPRELEIDPRSGMKNYIANETGGWDTSSALVRRTLTQCIEAGRRARQTGRTEDLYEAYRLLGQALHTLEDLPAHSNWCEIALLKLGFRDVFCHVGDNVRVQAPNGERVPPLVTGTFGSADFIHSLLGEAQDHLSEASVSDLTKAVNNARSQQGGSRGIGEGGGGAIGNLMGLLNKVPGGPDGSVSRDIEDLSRAPAGGVDNMSPEEMYQNLWRILSLRDRIMKSIEQTIEKIPGLGSLLESISNAISVFIFTTLEPYLKPLVAQAMGGLATGSAQVIKKEDQFEVFNDPNASDPTHSMLSKDHFSKILNEVAGNVARIIVKHTVTNVVKAWDDPSASVDRVVDESLACMFHPYWHHPQAVVQRDMLEYVETWSRTHHAEIRRLDRQNCRNHTDTRSGKAEHGGCGHGGGGGGNNNDVPGGAGGKFGAQAAGAFSDWAGNKVHGMMPPQMQQLGNQFNKFNSREAGEGGGESAGYYGGGGSGNDGREGGNGGGDYGRHQSEGSGGYYGGGNNNNEGSGFRPPEPEPRYGGGGPEYSSGGGGGGGYGAPSMPHEGNYTGGGGGFGGPSGGYGGPGGYGGNDGPGGYGGGPPQGGPGGFAAPGYGPPPGEYGGQSMYPGQQQPPYPPPQGYPPQNQGYGGNNSGYPPY
ncbi:hypothetical protein OC842_002976 [Tilletia horrida]|uniref:Het-C-domain-containing protein n=1 Tax=Tilletia horrida TaxID=155126 RepID=A0AAN6GGY7_9BASI|nr:hypothetical protein OC842_002976 [Tilletia horrida]KAK0560235.1 hypothetical protein OC844_003900 [Tilletia horrida]